MAMTRGDREHSEPCQPDETTPEPEGGERPPELPDEATIVSESTLISPKGRRYRILRTNQQDAYDDPAAGEETDPEARDRDE